MHILIIAPEEIPVPPLKGGSVEICIEQIAKRLARNHKVTVISRQHEKYANVQTNDHVTYIRVAPKPSRLSGASTSSASTLWERYIKAVVRKLKGNKFDWIQIDNRPKFIPYIRSVFPRTPISLFLHSLTFISPKKISRNEAAHCLAKANLIISNSESTKRQLQRLFPRISSRIKKVWLGVDDTVFLPGTRETRKQTKQKYKVNNGFTLLFVGRVIPRKGIPVLLKAAQIARKKVPSLRVVIAGSGRQGYMNRLKSLSRKLKVSAQFIGKIPHRQIHEVYWMADCFICPSQEHESFGLVNVEAMASGLPLIASRIGGIKEIVRHKHNGLLVKKYRSPQQFANYIAQIAVNKDWAEKLKLQARKDAVSRFNWEATARKILKLYKG